MGSSVFTFSPFICIVIHLGRLFILAAIKIKATEVACIMKRLLLGLLIDCWL